ncbi:helix-turn-helix domain-containing protein [Nocardia farcinica]|uniref:helix-turn-helix domain-containing protein n=1 Tax=Nocardia farcinica TaxID=37329 RepID=UPI0018935883|nr:helix-turn-helix transcriptional regulator [Nocardia farcinica]MBF6574107.1 helix-turn-helix transcriptional regulator [Nocardia farcinica]
MSPRSQAAAADHNGLLGAQLRAARETAGLSLQDMADHAEVPYAKSTLGHFENGTRRIPPDAIACYQRVCGKFADPVTSVIALGKADVQRRSFLRGIGYSAALSATGLVTASDLDRVASLGAGRRIGMADVKAAQAVTDAFVHLDEVSGGGIGRTTLAEYLATDVAAMLRGRFADDATRSAAISTAAELAYCAGFKAHDVGEDGIAQRYYLAALRLAEQSGTPGHDAFVLRILALQSSDVRERRWSVALAEEALRRLGAGVSPDTRALFTVALARVHADVGEFDAARAVLGQAEPHIGPDPMTEQPRYVAMWFPTKATLANHAAKACAAMGELAAAEAYSALSASMWDRTSHARIWALTTAETGFLRWRQGRHQEATDAWSQAVPVLRALESTRATTVLGRIRKTAPALVEL